MSSGDFSDPRAFRWVESGVSGLARTREWDATAILDAPGLVGRPETELELTAYPDGSIRAAGDVARPELERLAGALDSKLARPFWARAVRRGPSEWMVGGRELDVELVELDPAIQARSLEVVVAPDGERTAFVDGELVRGATSSEVGVALADLERRGRERFQSFAARADKVEGPRWDLTIDAL